MCFLSLLFFFKAFFTSGFNSQEGKAPTQVLGFLACPGAPLKNSVHSLLTGVLSLKCVLFITKPRHLFHVRAWPVSGVL